MSTLFYDARKDRGISNLTKFSMEMAGDVGYELTGTVVKDPIAKGTALTLLLDGGQRRAFVVDKPGVTRAGGGGTEYNFTAYEAGAYKFKKSQILTRHYLTMTEAEYRRFAEQLAEKGTRPDLKYHVKLGDEFGRKGWKTSDVIRQIASMVGLDVVFGIKDLWVRDVVIPAGMSLLRIALELVSILDPIVEIKDNVLLILPRQAAADAHGALVAASTLLWHRDEPTEYAADASVRATGGEGPFRLDKWKGNTYSGFSYPGSRWASLRKESQRVRNIINGIKWQGEVEVEQKESKSDTQNERRVVLRYYLHSVTGGRLVELATRVLVYDTSGYFEVLKRLEETIREYEGLNWSCRAPRLKKMTQTISGYGWELVDGDQGPGFRKCWYSPLTMTVTEYTWSSREVGIQERVLKTTTGVIGTFEEAGEEDKWPKLTWDMSWDEGEWSAVNDPRTWKKVGIAQMSADDAKDLVEIRDDVNDTEATLIEQIEIRYVPVSPYMYGVEQHTLTIVPQRNEETTKYTIALSEVPQHVLAARGQEVYYEEGIAQGDEGMGIGGEGTQDTPGINTIAPMILDWDDIEDHGREAAKERGMQYLVDLTIPGGTVVIPRGLPVKIDCGTDGVVLGECTGVSVSQDAKSGVESIIHVKQRQVA